MGKIIGIDLGTTNSCVSVLDGEKTRIIENAEGKRTTPSVIAYTGDEILVGEAAQRQRVTNPKKTIFGIKRLIGNSFDSKEVQKDLEIMPFDIIKAKNGDAWVKVGEKEFAPPQISAEILKKMKTTAEEYLGEKVTGAVITVPAYFNDAQRQATKDAGQIAGLDVKRIINEPTAAALAYGMDNKKEDQIVAVYDLGGGTFDISIIEIEKMDDGEQTIEVLSTNGDTHLGGEDFDNVLINYVVSEFNKDNDMDLKQDPLAMQRIKESAEKAKIELSSAMQTEINLPYVTANETGPKHLNVKITRAKLESLVEDLIDRTFVSMKNAIEDSGNSISEIDDVILVGGMTRMPMVQQKVAEFFGKEPRKDVNPDEAVATGAAIQGGVLSGDINDILLLDVTPLSLGIETMGGVTTVMVEKNTTIPTVGKETFSTADDNQTTVTIHVVQGERKKASENKSLGRFDLSGIPLAARGEPQIEVSFDLNVDGILDVTAKDTTTGVSQKITIKASGGMTDEEIEKAVAEAELNAEADEKFANMVEKTNQAESLIYSVKKELGETVNEMINGKIKSLEDAVSAKDVSVIESAMKDLQSAIQAFVAEKQQSQQEQTESPQQDTSKADEDIVDAEFEEVK